MDRSTFSNNIGRQRDSQWEFQSSFYMKMVPHLALLIWRGDAGEWKPRKHYQWVFYLCFNLIVWIQELKLLKEESRRWNVFQLRIIAAESLKLTRKQAPNHLAQRFRNESETLETIYRGKGLFQIYRIVDCFIYFDGIKLPRNQVFWSFSNLSTNSDKSNSYSTQHSSSAWGDERDEEISEYREKTKRIDKNGIWILEKQKIRMLRREDQGWSTL